MDCEENAVRIFMLQSGWTEKTSSAIIRSQLKVSNISFYEQTPAELKTSHQPQLHFMFTAN